MRLETVHACIHINTIPLHYQGPLGAPGPQGEAGMNGSPGAKGDQGIAGRYNYPSLATIYVS